MGADDIREGISRDATNALARARSALAEAWELMRMWRHGTDEWVSAGYAAVTMMNQAATHLSHARGSLQADIDGLPPQPVALAEPDQPDTGVSGVAPVPGPDAAGGGPTSGFPSVDTATAAGQGAIDE